MSAADVASLLGGSRQGRLWLCPCPVPTHGKGRGDRNPSLLVSDDRDGREKHRVSPRDRNMPGVSK